jgi:DNA polymerase-3 subunit alpha
MTTPAFVHLRAQSAYSMLEGAIAPDLLPRRVRAHGQPAVALLDRNGLFAAMEFAEAAIAAGVQPVVGALLAVGGHWLALLVQDAQGWTNLSRLVSSAWLNGEGHIAPQVGMDELAAHADGLIALTAGPEGAVARLLADGRDAEAAAQLDALAAIFPGRLYVELSRQGDAIMTTAEARLVALADARGLPLVATNPAHFADPSAHGAHDALLCIAEGAYVETAQRRRSNPHAWLKPTPAMVDLFADLPDALANTLVVAQRCAFAPPRRDPILPQLEGDLGAAARAGLEARLAALGEAMAAPREAYLDRLAQEVAVIERMGFAGYFLIVADFIQWAKRQGIPVGPGRGSGAGSVVAWALTITDLDPLRHGLLFERFLNPERVSMPDFDIDFCETRRDEVIRYVRDRYGADRVAQIITFGTFKARAAVKDVGRVLQMSYGQVDRLSKLIPNNPADPWTLKRALGGVPELAAERDRDASVARLFDIALQIEGLPRHASTHAAGVVIADRPLMELAPLYRDPRGDLPATQFDMKWVEKAGLVKFDFLGLKTLSVLERIRTLLAGRDVVVDWAALPLDDRQVYTLMAQGRTVGVFQLESDGMRRTLAQVKPDRFEDIVALVSLYRPGPMDNIPSFAARKHGREAVSLPHPALEAVLGETYGLIVYQEQVMQAAQILAGYSLGEADLLRRAMGKKKKEEMDAQRARFVAGCVERGTEAPQAEAIFELIAKFAGYGFNKSHAAAYALLAYHTAWAKTHHPVEFYAASMDFDRDSTDKLALFVEDARRERVRVLPPCINASQPGFSVEAGAVRYGLAALKCVGERAMASVAAVRGDRPFASLSDFAQRVDHSLLNKRVIESLAGGGAFDAIHPNRAGAHALADAVLAAAGSAQQARQTGQRSFFGDSSESGEVTLALVAPRDLRWTAAQRAEQERDALGFFFEGHPLEDWRHVLVASKARSWAEAHATPPAAAGGRVAVVLAGVVENCRWRNADGGRRFLVADMSDASGAFEVSAWEPEPQDALQRALAESVPVLIHGALAWRDGQGDPRVSVTAAAPLPDIARRLRAAIEIELDAAANVEVLARLPRGGRAGLIARVRPHRGGLARVQLGEDFLPDAEFCAALRRAEGVKLLH